MKRNWITLAATFAGLANHTASGHTTYGGTARDLGTVIPSISEPYFKTIDNQTVTSNFGWAAGTDGDRLGNAHDIKAYRFTLAAAGVATISLSGAARGTGVQPFLPAFSLYSGLLHTSVADYDTAAITLFYLATLGGTQPKNGAFNALDTWKIGNDEGTTFADLSTLTYLGNAADGTSSDFGNAVGIHGDGLADGFVQQSFLLPAGDYSLIIGGAGITGSDLTGTYGINASLAVVPEPSAAVLAGLSTMLLLVRRRLPR